MTTSNDPVNPEQSQPQYVQPIQQPTQQPIQQPNQVVYFSQQPQYYPQPIQQPQYVFVQQSQLQNQPIYIPQQEQQQQHSYANYNWAYLFFALLLGFEAFAAYVVTLPVFFYFLAIPCAILVFYFGVVKQSLGWLYFGIAAHFCWWAFSVFICFIFGVSYYYNYNIMITIGIVFFSGCFNLGLALYRRKEIQFASSVNQQQQSTNTNQNSCCKISVASLFFAFFIGCQLVAVIGFIRVFLIGLIGVPAAGIVFTSLLFDFFWGIIFGVIFEGFLFGLVFILMMTTYWYTYGLVLWLGYLTVVFMGLVCAIWACYRTYKLRQFQNQTHNQYQPI